MMVMNHTLWTSLSKALTLTIKSGLAVSGQRKVFFCWGQKEGKGIQRLGEGVDLSGSKVVYLGGREVVYFVYVLLEEKKLGFSGKWILDPFILLFLVITYYYHRCCCCCWLLVVGCWLLVVGC